MVEEVVMPDSRFAVDVMFLRFNKHEQGGSLNVEKISVDNSGRLDCCWKSKCVGVG